MVLKILRTKKEYQGALERFGKIFQAKDGKDKHFVIQAQSPLEAIKYTKDQQGLSNKDLGLIWDIKSG